LALFGACLLWVLGSFSPHDWALICLVSGPYPIGLMLDVFLVYFERIFHVLHKCPPANGQTSKLVEFISSKALFLSLVFTLEDFYARVGG
jgi:hypothetical protein